MIRPTFPASRILVTFISIAIASTIRAQPVASHTTRYVEPNEATGTSMAAVAAHGPLAHSTQVLPLNKNGSLRAKGDLDGQIEQVLKNLSTSLKKARSGLEHLVKVNVYVAQQEMVPKVQDVFARKFSGRVKPAASFVVGNLSHPDALVAMDAVAMSTLKPGKSPLQKFRSASLSGPPSAAHVAVLPMGGAVYVSGQADRGELADSTRKTLESLQKTLAHLGLNREHIVQLKAFLRPMSQVSVVEKEIAQFFEGDVIPPVVFVEWISSIPIEIELIAASVGDQTKAAESVTYVTPPGMTASPVYSKVARINHGRTVYVSGLYGKTSQNAEAQVQEIFDTLGQLLKKSGSDFKSLVKATYYVSDNPASNKLNELRPKFYDPQRPPAASKAMVPGVGVAGKSITFDMIAVAPD